VQRTTLHASRLVSLSEAARTRRLTRAKRAEDDSRPLATITTSRANPAAGVRDAELLAVSDDARLEAFDLLDRYSGYYVSRVVDHISFPAHGEQLCRRELQLVLPAIDTSRATDLFIVSLGRFLRRRFPDISVRDGRGVRLQLLSRRQHGYVMAVKILCAHLEQSELDRIPLHDDLQDMYRGVVTYLARLLTTFHTDASCTLAGAEGRLRTLLLALRAGRPRVDSELFAFHDACLREFETTKYLCWVPAAPGTCVQLTATYTQADAPLPCAEPEIARPPLMGAPWATSLLERIRAWRLKWRDRRNSFYTKLNMMPMYYVFATPVFGDVGSYYFLFTPPEGTEVALLDWGRGRRLAPRDHDVRSTSTAEIDTAHWAYHFHNRRVGQRRVAERRRDTSERRAQGADRRSRRPPASPDRTPLRVSREVGDTRFTPRDRRRGERRWSQRRAADRRASDGPTCDLIHAFVRTEQRENLKLIAVGILSIGLCVLAARGVLQTGAGDSTSQILLLAPATLVLFVDQQSKHHYAAFTRIYRVILWGYIVLALAFAVSIVFDVTKLPLIRGNVSGPVARYASALFAIASAVLVIAFWWGGTHHTKSAGKRLGKLIDRVDDRGTPSRVDTWLKRLPAPAFIPRTIGGDDPRDQHPPFKLYTATVRHSADRVIVGTVLGVLAAVGVMLLVSWGTGEECAIARIADERKALTAERQLLAGRCYDTRYVPEQTSPPAALSGTRGSSSKHRS